MKQKALIILLLLSVAINVSGQNDNLIGAYIPKWNDSMGRITGSALKKRLTIPVSDSPCVFPETYSAGTGVRISNRTLTWGAPYYSLVKDPYDSSAMIRSWFSSVRTEDRDHKIVEEDSMGYRVISNYKRIPSGYYCDTVFQDDGRKIGRGTLTITIFVDRKIIVRVYFSYNKGSHYTCDIDEKFFGNRGR